MVITRIAMYYNRGRRALTSVRATELALVATAGLHRE